MAQSDMMQWPRPLKEARGPIREDKLDGAAQGMGDWGEALQALCAEGILPPDIITAQTLFILSSQPRDPAKKQAMPGGGGGGVAGGVWVRERYTIHRPLSRTEAFTVKGFAQGRHVHKGRRYGTNSSQTYTAQGDLAATNLTTGLLAYKVQEGLSDTLEGADPELIKGSGVDRPMAANNPCLDALKKLTKGTELGGYEMLLGLNLMEVRDTKKPDNPIHSDPELARKAGLAKPIAGGAHVLSFALESILQATGAHALLHGTYFDIRWKTPVYADTSIWPSATVVSASAEEVIFDVKVQLAADTIAMVGQVTVPLA